MAPCTMLRPEFQEPIFEKSMRRAVRYPSFCGGLLAIPFLLMITGGLLRAESTVELQEQLHAALRAEMQAALKDTTPAGWERCRALQTMFVQFSQSELNGFGNDNLSRTVEGVQSVTTSPTVIELCQRLKKQLRIEQTQQEAALIQEVREGLTAALRDALRSRKKLDASAQTITQLVEKANAARSSNYQLRDLAQLGQRLADYIHRFQDYSVGEESGESLHPQWLDLMNSSNGFSALIPRSEVLAQSQKKQRVILTLQQQDQEVREILSHVHSLDDIDAALAALEKVGQVETYANLRIYRYDVEAALRGYQTVLHESNAGAATTVHLRQIVESATAASDDTLSELRTQLLLRLIPRLLGGQSSLPVEPKDNAATYLHRTIAAARDKADWPLLVRTLTLMDELGIDPEYAGHESAAARLFLGALNQECAHEYAAAVCSYQLVLKTGTQVIPAEFIGERLEHLRTAEPEEFKKGIALAQTAVAPRTLIRNSRGNTMYLNRSIVDLAPSQGDIIVPAAPQPPPPSAAVQAAK